MPITAPTEGICKGRVATEKTVRRRGTVSSRTPAMFTIEYMTSQTPRGVFAAPPKPLRKLEVFREATRSRTDEAAQEARIRAV